jgi:hypothetical protein
MRQHSSQRVKSDLRGERTCAKHVCSVRTNVSSDGTCNDTADFESTAAADSCDDDCASDGTVYSTVKRATKSKYRSRRVVGSGQIHNSSLILSQIRSKCCINRSTRLIVVNASGRCCRVVMVRRRAHGHTTERDRVSTSKCRVLHRTLHDTRVCRRCGNRCCGAVTPTHVSCATNQLTTAYGRARTWHNTARDACAQFLLFVATCIGWCSS